MNIYTADPSDPFIKSIQSYLPNNEELFECAEPFKDNIVRGEDHPSFGHRWSMTEESRDKVRKSKLGELNPMYGKTSSKNQKKALSQIMKGVPKSDDQKEKMSQAKLGVVKSLSHREAMAEAHRQRCAEKVRCPHCNKYCSKGHWATQRFHFDNCKAR